MRTTKANFIAVLALAWLCALPLVAQPALPATNHVPDPAAVAYRQGFAAGKAWKPALTNWTFTWDAGTNHGLWLVYVASAVDSGADYMYAVRSNTFTVQRPVGTDLYALMVAVNCDGTLGDQRQISRFAAGVTNRVGIWHNWLRWDVNVGTNRYSVYACTADGTIDPEAQPEFTGQGKSDQILMLLLDYERFTRRKFYRLVIE